ncbi:AcvB/VirJ family lysyl-phosphatidylglycerol hydrolase [Sphingomonas sp. 1P08PE]|uniref:AcvB/VirJ family lysyl-phosphatidylglycerol hydrolase n=1 Tax=Sphingomonas sp. 1P08PE TaxID=554122 RepID=UPI0039A06CD2
MNTRPSRRRTRILTVFAAVVAALAAWIAIGGYLDRDPIDFFAATGPRKPVAALYFSGDSGLRFGMGPYAAKALAEHGIAVTGFSSPAYFSVHRTRAEVNAAVAGAIREALARTGGERLVVIGQSYGADILQTGLAALPADLRPRIVAVVLVVPGEGAFFRADPLGLEYRGTPDSLGVNTVNAITWAPLTCIYGVAETDSLCPAVRLPRATIVRMPGGHFLDHDSDGLVRHVLDAIRRSAPTAFAKA